MWSAESGLRIGTVFEGWSEGLPSYVHAYGNYGAAIDGIPFHQLWLRARAQELVARFDQFCVAAELGRLSRIGLAESAGEQASGIGYGRHLTVDRYHALMHDYALHLGAATRPCRRVEPRIRDEDGFVDALILDTGEVVSADLFIDCTGPAALIHSALHGEFDDWAKWLPCDRMAFTESQSEQDDSMLDSAI